MPGRLKSAGSHFVPKLPPSFVATLPLGFRVAFFGALVAVAWLATTSSPSVTSVPIWDKAQHVAAFLALAFLLDYAWPAADRALSASQRWKWALLVAYGVALELMQTTLDARQADLADVFADTVGVLLYLLARGPLAWIPVLREIRGDDQPVQNTGSPIRPRKHGP